MNLSKFKFPVPQSDPPLPPRLTLPTMYDLPSENPEEPGLDEFHTFQPQLLSRTFCPPGFPPDRRFTAADLNLYFDVRHVLWYKRPDWFAVVGIDRFYEGTDLRASYVVWQEGINPFVVVELLSPGTEKEDLGQNIVPDPARMNTADANGQDDRSDTDRPPRKWDVYEKILRIPYYFVFSRYTHQLRCFQLVGGHYQEQPIAADQPRIWIPQLELGLGVWEGTFEGITRSWIRWYDQSGNWVPTDTERAQQATELAREEVEQERQRAEQERQRAEQERQLREELLEKLRARGIDPDTL